MKDEDISPNEQALRAVFDDTAEGLEPSQTTRLRARTLAAIDERAGSTWLGFGLQRWAWASAALALGVGATVLLRPEHPRHAGPSADTFGQPTRTLPAPEREPLLEAESGLDDWFGWAEPVAGAPVIAREPPGKASEGRPPEETRKEAQTRLKLWFAGVLRKQVGLDEKQAQAVEQALERARQQRKVPQKDAKAQRQALSALLDRNSDDEPAYQRALASLRASTEKLDSLKLQEQAELSKLLTGRQAAGVFRAIAQLKSKARIEIGRSDEGWSAEP